MELMELKRPVKSFEPFEWMVKFTPQKEWIERRGILLWLAFFFGFGAGLYLVASYFNSLWGMFIGWLIIAFGFGGFHLLYLGKPLRFWRAILRPQRSWISRGLIFASGFLAFGAIHMALIYWQPETAAVVAFGVITGIFAFLTAIYTGFAMNYVRALPFWNNPLLPVIIVTCELLGGLAIALALSITIGDGIEVMQVESWSRILLSAYAIMLVIYMLSVTYGPEAGKEAVRRLLSGRVSFSIPFWVGLALIGIVLPLILAWYPYAAGMEIGHPWLFGAIACDVVGGLSLRYITLRGGIYAPLLPLHATKVQG